jgi:DnaJ-class molecular chaperone
MPDVSDRSGRHRGDLFVTVKVQTPKKLTKEQRKAIEDLKKILPADVVQTERDSGDKPFFERVKDIFG